VILGRAIPDEVIEKERPAAIAVPLARLGRLEEADQLAASGHYAERPPRAHAAAAAVGVPDEPDAPPQNRSPSRTIITAEARGCTIGRPPVSRRRLDSTPSRPST
jgi:hypothetical protein